MPVSSAQCQKLSCCACFRPSTAAIILSSKKSNTSKPHVLSWPFSRRSTSMLTENSSAKRRSRSVWHTAHSGSSCLDREFGEREVEGYEHERKYREHQQAALRANGAPGQPRWTVKRGIEQVTLRHHPAIRDAVDVALRPIPGRVQADGEPKGSRSPHGETKE